MTPLFIPSPAWNGIHLGPLTIHFYAICIVLGMVAGLWLGRRRWLARGGTSESLESVLVWAIVAGIVGARLYHVITDYQLYFGPGRDWWRMFFIWEGGLGIWGAVALGGLAAWLACRRRGLAFPALADALAPGIILAQGIGRLGNWFNQELFGRPLSAPWALAIDASHRPAGYEQFATFHPTFLYELVWDLAVAAALVLLDRRFRLGHGKLFALYVALYCAGRLPIEHLKIDTVNKVGGLRVNEYVSSAVLLAALGVLAWLFWKRPGREDVVESGPTDEPAVAPTGMDAVAGAVATPTAPEATAEQPVVPVSVDRACDAAESAGDGETASDIEPGETTSDAEDGVASSTDPDTVAGAPAGPSTSASAAEAGSRATPGNAAGSAEEPDGADEQGEPKTPLSADLDLPGEKAVAGADQEARTTGQTRPSKTSPEPGQAAPESSDGE